MAKKTDSNQTQVVKELRQMGYSVEPIHTLGSGRPDLLVGQWGFNFLIELKDPSKPPSKRKLTPDEDDWHGRWRGHVFIGHTSEQIDAEIQGFLNDICPVDS